MSYFLLLNETQAGPFTLSQVRNMWNQGSITANTPYWREGLGNWVPLKEMESMLESAPSSAPVRLPQPSPAAQAIFAEALPVRRPSAMISMAYACFLLSVLLTCTVILAILSWIPWIISSILMIVLFCNEHPDAQKAAGRILLLNFFFFIAAGVLVAYLLKEGIVKI